MIRVREHAKITLRMGRVGLLTHHIFLCDQDGGRVDPPSKLASLRMASLLFFLAAFLIGCDKSADAKKNSPAELKEIRLGYFANLTHAQALLGVDSGEFAKAVAPVQFKTRVFNAGPALIEALAANAIDIGYVGPGPVLTSYNRSHGQAVRIISGAAANGVVLVAGKDSGIKSLADLKNKRIATPQRANTQDISARHFVTAQLGQDNHDNVIPIPNTETQILMMRGQIDAAWVPEPWGARLVIDAGAKIIAEEKDFWPDQKFPITVIVTTPEFLHAHPDVVTAMLKVHNGWTMKLNTDPATQTPLLLSALQKVTGNKFPEKIAHAALPRILFTNDPIPSTFEAMAQWSFDLQFGPAPENLDKLFELQK